MEMDERVMKDSRASLSTSTWHTRRSRPSPTCEWRVRFRIKLQKKSQQKKSSNSIRWVVVIRRSQSGEKRTQPPEKKENGETEEYGSVETLDGKWKKQRVELCGTLARSTSITCQYWSCWLHSRWTSTSSASGLRRAVTSFTSRVSGDAWATETPHPKKEIQWNTSDGVVIIIWVEVLNPFESNFFFFNSGRLDLLEKFPKLG